MCISLNRLRLSRRIRIQASVLTIIEKYLFQWNSPYNVLIITHHINPTFYNPKFVLLTFSKPLKWRLDNRNEKGNRVYFLNICVTLTFCGPWNDNGIDLEFHPSIQQVFVWTNVSICSFGFHKIVFSWRTLASVCVCRNQGVNQSIFCNYWISLQLLKI